jgi:hypothetical protein
MGCAGPRIGAAGPCNYRPIPATTGSRRQQALDLGRAHTEQLGCLPNAQPALNGSEDTLLVCRDRRSSQSLPSCPRSGQTGLHPLLDHRALKLSEHAEHLEHGPTTRCGGVDGLLMEEEIDARGPNPGMPGSKREVTTRLQSSLAMHLSPRCHARTRFRSPCQSPAVNGRRRCRMHGGARGSSAKPGDHSPARRYPGRTGRKELILGSDRSPERL